MKHILKHSTLFLIGGSLYYLIETIYKGILHGTGSHWSMFVLGGICFVSVGLINELFTYDLSIIIQCIIGSFLITVLEFITGYIVNIKLGLNVWDYSGLPCNAMGQICLYFTFIWFGLSFLCIILDRKSVV